MADGRVPSIFDSNFDTKARENRKNLPKTQAISGMVEEEFGDVASAVASTVDAAKKVRTVAMLLSGLSSAPLTDSELRLVQAEADSILSAVALIPVGSVPRAT